MTPSKLRNFLILSLALPAVSLLAADTSKLASASPKTEAPQPTVIDPGPVGGPPADAIVLFDGKDLSKFRGQRAAEPHWKIEAGIMESTSPGGIFTKEDFGDCQLHVEFATPAAVKGEGQG